MSNLLPEVTRTGTVGDYPAGKVVGLFMGSSSTSWFTDDSDDGYNQLRVRINVYYGGYESAEYTVEIKKEIYNHVTYLSSNGTTTNKFKTPKEFIKIFNDNFIREEKELRESKIRIITTLSENISLMASERELWKDVLVTEPLEYALRNFSDKEDEENSPAVVSTPDKCNTPTLPIPTPVVIQGFTATPTTENKVENKPVEKVESSVKEIISPTLFEKEDTNNEFAQKIYESISRTLVITREEIEYLEGISIDLEEIDDDVIVLGEDDNDNDLINQGNLENPPITDEDKKILMALEEIRKKVKDKDSTTAKSDIATKQTVNTTVEGQAFNFDGEFQHQCYE